MLDIICIVFIICNIKYLFNIIKNKFVFVHVIRCVGLYIIGVVSFFWFSGYWMDNGNRFLTISKGWVYSIATLIFTFKYMNKSINLLYPFAIILLNGMISSFFVPLNQIWVRYGNRVVIIDQEDATTISNFVITFLIIKCLYVKDKNKLHRIINVVMLVVFLVQNLYCVYKTNLVVLAAVIAVYLILSKGRNQIMILATVVGIPSVLVTFWEQIYGLINSVSINTRQSQFTDYLNHIKEEGIYPYLFGSGISTPYYSNTDTEDTGERKITDLTSNKYASQWRTDIQTPIISIFKDSGIVGLLYFFITTMYLVIKNFKFLKDIFSSKVKKDYLYVETISIGIILLIETVYSVFLYGGTLPFCIFYTFCLAKFVINYKKIKETEQENENRNHE